MYFVCFMLSHNLFISSHICINSKSLFISPKCERVVLPVVSCCILKVHTLVVKFVFCANGIAWKCLLDLCIPSKYMMNNSWPRIDPCEISVATGKALIKWTKFYLPERYFLNLCIFIFHRISAFSVKCHAIKYQILLINFKKFSLMIFHHHCLLQ